MRLQVALGGLLGDPTGEGGGDKAAGGWEKLRVKLILRSWIYTQMQQRTVNSSNVFIYKKSPKIDFILYKKKL